MPNIQERLAKLKGEEKSKNPKSEGLDSPKIDRRKFNKRTPGTGRKPKEANIIAKAIKARLDEHFNGQIEITFIDQKTGKKRTEKKSRIVAALEKLFTIGMRDNGDPDALNKWLDRALGKPLQKVGGSEDEPIHLKVDIDRILDVAYGPDR